MEIKRIAIGFVITLTMAFCLSLVADQTHQISSVPVEDENNHIAEYKAQ